MTIYGYYPNLGANAFLCAYFAIFLIANLVLGFRHKTWLFSSLVAIGSLSEMIGYIGRIMLHSNPWSNAGFEIQICTLIFAPSFFAAAIYITLKGMVRAIGPQFSPIKAVLYPWIFITCDFLSLLLQAIGGGIAASANTPSGSAVGGRIMLSGIVFQVATFTFLYCLAVSFGLNLRRNMSTLSPEGAEVLRSRDFKTFAIGILVSSIAVYLRCVYRVGELATGWANEIMRNETSFIVLDGVMCCIAILALTVCHPGIYFKPMAPRVNEKKTLGPESSEIDV